MTNTKETLLFSAAVGFFIMWLSELFRAIPFAQNYVWLMFSIVSLLYFQYSKNERLKKEGKPNSPSQAPKKKKK
jgi:hypothetical protein